MDQPEPFSWRVGILDDRESSPYIDSTVDMLEGAGLAAYSLSTLEQMKDNISLLRKTDIFLVDMNWEAQGQSRRGKCSLPALSRRISDDDALLWLDSLAYWTSCNNDEWNTPGEYPSGFLKESIVGVWLGALMSAIQSRAHIRFFTQVTELERNEPILQALRHYPALSFDIHTKSEYTGFGVEHLQPILARLQARLLRERTDVADWFIRKVLIPHVLGQEPRSAVLSDPRDPNQPALTYTASTFVPQVQRLQLDQLRALLPRNGGLKDWEVVVLKFLEHEVNDRNLQDLRGDRLSQDDIRRLEDLSGKAWNVGARGEAIAACFQRAIEDGVSVETRYTHLLEARRRIGEFLHNDEVSLANWLERIGGWAKGESLQTEGRQLPFLLADVEMVHAALMDNAKKHDGHQWGMSSSAYGADELLLEWQDDSQGFRSKGHFDKSILESLQKRQARARGLPLALEFALVNRALSCQVFIGGEQKWVPLLGPNVELPIPKSGFAVAWKFARSQHEVKPISR